MQEVKTIKRETAYKLRINDLFRGKQIFEESESLNKRLKFIELGDRKIVRINIIANVIDKYESDGERKFANITLDDGSGQIRARVFGEEINKFKDLIQGDTVLIIGFVHSFNQEIYVLPEIIKKHEPKYLLVRKLEIEKSFPSPATPEHKKHVKALRDEMLELIKNAESNEGIDKEELIMRIKARPELISQEIQKLLEEGITYEPKPGRVRYLG
jgi:RPA family protein